MIAGHCGPHFNAAGLCVCDCRPCTSLGWCCCPDCPCDGLGDRGDEHVPDDCWGLETGLRVVALIPALSAPPWFPLFGDGLRPEPLAFGTYCSPVPFLPIRSAEEIAADERREAAGKVLAVLREATPKPRAGRVRRLKADPWPPAGRLAPGDEAPAAMISGRAQGGRASAVLPARVEPRPPAISLRGQSCAACVLGAVPRLLPLGFPLAPASSMSSRRVNLSASPAGTSNSEPASSSPIPWSVNVFGCLPV